MIANGKRGTLTIGEKVVAAATSPALDKSVAIELTPTLQADGSVNMPIKLTFAEEKLVGQKPSTSTRQMMLELKVHPGNKASFVTPRADGVEPMGMSIQLDLLDRSGAFGLIEIDLRSVGRPADDIRLAIIRQRHYLRRTAA